MTVNDFYRRIHVKDWVFDLAEEDFIEHLDDEIEASRRQTRREIYAEWQARRRYYRGQL